MDTVHARIAPELFGALETSSRFWGRSVSEEIRLSVRGHLMLQALTLLEAADPSALAELGPDKPAAEAAAELRARLDAHALRCFTRPAAPVLRPVAGQRPGRADSPPAG